MKKKKAAFKGKWEGVTLGRVRQCVTKRKRREFQEGGHNQQSNMFWAQSNKIKIMNILGLQPRDSFSVYSAHFVQCWFISLASICSCANKSMVGEELFYVHSCNCSYMCVIAL